MFETEEKGGKDPCHNPLLISIRIISASSFPELNHFPCFTCGIFHRDKNCVDEALEFMSFRCIMKGGKKRVILH